METIRQDVDILLLRIKNHDENAFNDLYDLTARILYRVIYSYIKNREDSEDILSDTYYNIAKSIDKFKGKNGFNWIYTIAKNLSLDFIRKQKYKVIIDPNTEEDINKYNLEDKKNNSTQEKLNEVMKVCKILLKPSELNILLLHTLEGLSFKEIATLTKGLESTVRWKYNEILKKIRQELERRDIKYE